MSTSSERHLPEEQELPRYSSNAVTWEPLSLRARARQALADTERVPSVLPSSLSCSPALSGLSAAQQQLLAPEAAMCLQSTGQAGNLSPIWQLPPALPFLPPLTHFLLISPVLRCSFFLFPFSARSLWLPSLNSLLFHVFHHFFWQL